MTASLTLRTKIVQALRLNTPLTTVLGTAKIYDETPPNVVFPYINLGDSFTRNWSTDSDRGEEHRLTLHIWSREGGKKQAEIITSVLLDALDDMSLSLQGHHLVNMRFANAEIRREKDGRTYHGVITFRAVTEQL